MAPRVVLIDGSSLIFRAFFAIPSGFTTAAGLHTNATYGFALMFRKILDGKMPEYAAVVFDAPGPTFRDEKYPEYKAQRPAMSPDLVEQLPWIDKVVEVHDFPVLRVPGVEADDVIGTLTQNALDEGFEVHILSADKDFGQLIGERVRMVDTMRDITYDAEVVRKKWGVPPSQMRDYLALVGDKVDNVPGVPGIGAKTAAGLLDRFGDLQSILDNTDQLKGKQRSNLEEYREQALLSQDLVTIRRDLALGVALQDLRVTPPDLDKVNALYRELEFNSLLSDDSQKLDVDLAESDFEVTTTLEDLRKVLVEHGGRPVSVVAFTEPQHPVHGKLVGLGIGTPLAAWYVPIAAPDGGLGKPALDVLRPFLEDPNQPKVVHDLRDQWCILRRVEIDLRGVVLDTQLASFLIDPTKIIPHHLDQVAKEYLQRTLSPRKGITGSGKSQQDLRDVNLDELGVWAGHVTQAVAELAGPITERLEAEGHRQRHDELAVPMAYLLGQMQLHGVLVDGDDLAAMEVEFAARRDEIEAQVQDLAGHPFNLGSTKQLGEVLFDEMGLPVIKRTKTGYSTAADVLERLAPEHEIAAQVLRWRALSKLINTYTRVLREAISPVTGRVHATFQQTTGASGRLITTDPDLQRTPIRGEDGKRIRRAFVAPEGSVLISADWSQIELRMLAHFSGDRALVESFEQGVDLHRRTASGLFDVSPDEVTPRQRDIGKTVNFATIYGQGATALGQQLGIPRKEAKALIERYFEVYSGVRAWLDETVAGAHERGYVETLTGRRRYIRELSSNNPTDRAYGERIAANTPIQGSAADLCKLAMLKIDAALRAGHSDAKMVLQIHDELLFECPKGDLDDVSGLVRAAMEHPFELRVPLVVDIGWGWTWAAAH